MHDVKVNKEETLKVVIENMEKHVSDFTKSLINYKKYAEDAYKEALEILKTDGEVIRNFELDKPVSHLGDYNRVIKMLEMSVEQEISLTSHEFEQYIMDKWNWKDSFRLSNAKYATAELK